MPTLNLAGKTSSTPLHYTRATLFRNAILQAFLCTDMPLSPTPALFSTQWKSIGPPRISEVFLTSLYHISGFFSKALSVGAQQICNV